MSRNRGAGTGVGAVIAVIVLLTAIGAAQTPRTVPTNQQNAPQISEKDVAGLQDQLLQLLRLSPTLAEVVARDPSLLANAEYVDRNNPELGRFLQAHPEIAQNPDFYLFNNLHGEHEPPSEALERKLWPAMANDRGSDASRELISDGIPFLVFVCLLGALLWLTQVFLENRRWGRIFKLQTDVHGKLIERFGTSQEVLTYMSTDAGKRFLEATPIAVGFEQHQPLPSPVARVLTSATDRSGDEPSGIGTDTASPCPAGGGVTAPSRWDCRADARARVYHLGRNHVGVGPASGLDAGEWTLQRRPKINKLLP